MKLRGINYDIGADTVPGESSRKIFDKKVVKREIDIIANDLHCNAIRISGQDIDRLTYAAACALDQGMEVWFSPILHNATPEETLSYLVDCAKAAETLRKKSPHIVFVVGCELTFFMKGLVLGDNFMERIQAFVKPWRLLKSAIKIGSFNKNLNTFLVKAARLSREHFGGRMAYASGPWEQVNWGAFDFISVDYYWDRMTKRKYEKRIEKYKKLGKPVVITEFGCCTYEGAENKGGYAWTIVDRTKNPPELKGNYTRSEATQARMLQKLLGIYEKHKLHGAFVFTFSMQKYPTSLDPRHDIDMASYSIVKYLERGAGTTYPDMPWEPKESFRTIAEIYRQR